MRGMNAESADPIYLDPLLDSKRDYEALIGSAAAGAAFEEYVDSERSRSRLA